MKTRGRRLLHIILILAAMLAVFSRAVFAEPTEQQKNQASVTNAADPPPPSSWPVAATGEDGEPLPTDATEVTEPTTPWEPPTDEEGNTLFPPETTVKPTTTKKTTTNPPFVVNPAHPEDTYQGPLWYNKNPDLYETTEEVSTTENITTTEEWTMPEELGYGEGGMSLQKILGIAAAAILPIALAVAIVTLVKGRREAEREAREVARVQSAPPKTGSRIASTAMPADAAPLLNPLPPPVAFPIDDEDDHKASDDSNEPKEPEGDTHADILARFDEENPWFLESMKPMEKDGKTKDE